MIKRTITYKNFNDEEVTEDLYFHLSETELIKLESTIPGGLSGQFQKLVAAEDGKTIMEVMENMILLAYGKRSEDGRHFVKNAQIKEDFASSGAYNALFMQLVTDANFAAEFGSGILPKELMEEAQKTAAGEKLTAVEDKVEVQTFTKAEIESMPREQFAEIAMKIATGEIVVT